MEASQRNGIRLIAMADCELDDGPSGIIDWFSSRWFAGDDGSKENANFKIFFLRKWIFLINLIIFLCPSLDDRR